VDADDPLDAVDPAADRADLLARLTGQMENITARRSPAGPDPADRPSARSAEPPSERSAERSAGRPAGRPTDQPTDRPEPRTDRASGRSTDRADARDLALGHTDNVAPGHPEDDPGDPEAVAKAICLRLLTGAARPRAGLAAALARKGIPDDVADRVLDRLTEVGLIDDEAYAQSFVASRHRHGGLGAGALREELKRKGVDARIAASAVAVVDRDAEYQRARSLLERRVDSAMARGVDTARRRLLGLLARRGYPADLAERVVQDVITTYDAEVEASWS